MTEQSLVDLAEAAGDELAIRLRILVTSSTSTDSTTLAQGSTRASDMALSCWLTRPSRASSCNSPGMQTANGRALPLNLGKIQRELALQWPEAGFQANLWEGRTRQQPTRPGNRSEWAHLRGGRLKDYLSDMML